MVGPEVAEGFLGTDTELVVGVRVVLEKLPPLVLVAHVGENGPGTQKTCTHLSSTKTSQLYCK